MIFLGCRRHAFRALGVETYRTHQVTAVDLPDLIRIENLAWQVPWMVIWTWENDLIFPYTAVGFFRVPVPKRRRRVSGLTPYDLAYPYGQRQVMRLLRPASWQPLEPWRRSTISNLSPDPWCYQISHIVYETFWMRWELNDKHMRKHDPSKVFGFLHHLH